jgi:hypothetical protein
MSSQQSITPFLAAQPAYTVALGIPPRRDIEGAEDTCLRREGNGYGRQATDLTTSKPTLSGADQTGGVVELDFDKSVSAGVNIYAKRGDEGDFTFPASYSELSTINSQPSTREKLREYKCVYVLNDEDNRFVQRRGRGKLRPLTIPCFWASFYTGAIESRVITQLDKRRNTRQNLDHRRQSERDRIN